MYVRYNACNSTYHDHFNYFVNFLLYLCPKTAEVCFIFALKFILCMNFV